MSEQSYPTLNDFAPSWADIGTTFTVGGDGQLLETADYSAIKCGSTAEFGKQMGASGGRVLKRTTGSVEHECSATFYRSGLRKLIRAMVSKAPKIGNRRTLRVVALDILIQHTPPGETDIFVTKIKGCRLKGLSMEMAEGNDADQVELELDPIDVVHIIDGEEVGL